MGFSQHGRVVVGVSGGHYPEIQGFSVRRPRASSGWVAEFIVDDAAVCPNLQLVAENCGIAELLHQREGELIKGIGQDDDLGSFTQPSNEVGRSSMGPMASMTD